MPQLRQGCTVPFPSLIDIACDAAASRTAGGACIGLVATRATLASGLFEEALAARGRRALRPTDALLDAAMLPAIAHVKAGRLAQAGPLMAQAVQGLLDNGADLVVLACTEAPIALAAASGDLQARCVDSTLALAESTVALWQRPSAGSTLRTD